MSIELWLGILELVAIFATAMGGAFTAVRSARLDAVGVLTVGTMTALGGGVMRDLVIGAVPPAMFANVSYLLVAADRRGWSVPEGALSEALLGTLAAKGATVLAVLSAGPAPAFPGRAPLADLPAGGGARRIRLWELRPAQRRAE